MISASQIRAARALLNIPQEEVEIHTGLSKRYQSEIENERTSGKADAINKLELFYTSRGLEFMNNDGVRRNPTGLRILKGKRGFQEFYDDIYHTARQGKAEITLFNGVSDLVLDALGREFLDMHIDRMIEIKDRFRFRVIVEEGDRAFMGSSYCEYKWFPRDKFNNKTIYTYGTKVALINFDDEITITLIDQQGFADSQLLGFNLAWDHVATEPPHA